MEMKNPVQDKLYDAVVPRKAQGDALWVNRFKRLNSDYKLVHRHKEYEICYCPYDKGTFFISDKEYPIEPGDIFIVNSNEYHQPIYESKDNQGAIVVYFDIEFISPQYYPFSWLNIFLHSSNLSLNRIGQNEEIASLICNLKDTFDGDKVNSLTLCWGMLSHILALIEDQALSRHTKNLDFSTLKRQNEFDDVIEYIKRHLHEAISLNDLYSLSCLSKSQFSSKFKTAFGYTATEYICKERCKQAAALLKSNTKTISEIAYMCGFNNLSYFNRKFKGFHGISPREFRARS